MAWRRRRRSPPPSKACQRRRQAAGGCDDWPPASLRGRKAGAEDPVALGAGEAEASSAARRANTRPNSPASRAPPSANASSRSASPSPTSPDCRDVEKRPSGPKRNLEELDDAWGTDIRAITQALIETGRSRSRRQRAGDAIAAGLHRRSSSWWQGQAGTSTSIWHRQAAERRAALARWRRSQGAADIERALPRFIARRRRVLPAKITWKRPPDSSSMARRPGRRARVPASAAQIGMPILLSPS